jgi:broad specificity phosphatase PhoE
MMTLKRSAQVSFLVLSVLTVVSSFTNYPSSRIAVRVLSMAQSSEQEGPTLPEVSPTAKRLFLVRHGEVINPGGDKPVFYGALDVELSPRGKEEATAAAQYLSRFDLEHVFASPLSRAVFGAEEVRRLQQKNDVFLTIYEGFRELDRGAWCGKTKEEIGIENMKRFDDCDESVTPEGGESFPYLKDRVLKARDEALAKISLGGAAAVVSHLQ